MKEIIEKADVFARKEIEKFGVPILIHFESSNKIGQKLAKKLSVDKDIVAIGTRLMDIKLGEAKQQGKVKEHVEICVSATKDFLSQFDISEKIKEKIINCVEGHHGKVEWICKEAEVCANADCYRFLLVENWKPFFQILKGRKLSDEEAISFAEQKTEEKWNILSLDTCKEELEPEYKEIKDIIKTKRQQNI